ncbi:hypothetical protein Scep_015022 [Stephania cephalantha]|uniref:Uncharacterized protein n=1 Tax=Stephania cephalantha TaxID=152367 RepID=A0AAP0P3K2_9MAGN
MEGKEEDVNLGANKFSERQPLGTAAQDRDYTEPPPAPLFEASELSSWSFYRAGIAEFVATFLFLYVTILTVMGVKRSPSMCASVGIQGIAWAFGGMIFALVYCTAGISGKYGSHKSCRDIWATIGKEALPDPCPVLHNHAMPRGDMRRRRSEGLPKDSLPSTRRRRQHCRSWLHQGRRSGAEIVGTFVLVYTVFSATDAKRSARDSHVPLLAPLPIGFAVFLVHLATIPITGTSINPARSLGAAIIYNRDQAWDDHWIFWVGPFAGAALAALYHQVVIRAIPFRSKC